MGLLALALAFSLHASPAATPSAETKGMRARDTRYFRLRYFAGKRDFGQRADYEGRLVHSLEQSRTNAERVLGYVRSGAVDVVLYSREEFLAQFGPAVAQAAAGFYEGGAIRINGAAELTPTNRATLAHEYVHALVHELAGDTLRVPFWLNEGLAEHAQWRFQGSNGPPMEARHALRAAARAGQLPPLAVLARTPLIQLPNPSLMYAYAGAAAQLLLGRGREQLGTFLREVGQGADLDATMRTRFGIDSARLTQEVHRSFGGR